MTGTDRFNRRDWLIAATFFIVSLALRIPLRSHFAFYWDSAQFALAIEHYDMASSLPHPPGYFLYVMLGRLVNGLFHEPHTSLVWMSVVFGSALPSVLYLLGKATFSRAVGLIAGAIGATSLITWFYSLIAYSYVVDGFYVALFALLCWRARARGVAWFDVLALSALYALILGTRQQSGVTLWPLFLYTLWGGRELRPHKIALAMLLSGALVLLWLAPLTASTGGLRQYIEIARTHVTANRPDSPGAGVLGSILVNAGVIARFTAAGLLLATPVLVFAYLGRLRYLADVLTGRRADLRFWFYAAWLAPMIAFWSLVYTHIPGHVLSYFCGIVILTAASIMAVAHRFPKYGVNPTAFLITMVVVTVNFWAFFVRPPVVDALVSFTPLTHRDVRENDSRLAAAFRAIRQQFPADDVLICHVNEFLVWGYRQFQYHLAEYNNLLLTPDASLPGENGKKMWLGHRRQTRFVPTFAFRSYRTLLLVVPPGEKLTLFEPYLNVADARLVDGSEGTLFELPTASVTGGDELHPVTRRPPTDRPEN